MAETRLIQKQLAGVEDLLLGIGTATQTRATGPKTITKINADRLQGALVVDTIDELLALNPTLLVKGTCIVKDENRGGVFVYREANALVNNGGTIFNGWTRQYDGAVNVKWFNGDVQKAIDLATGITKTIIDGDGATYSPLVLSINKSNITLKNCVFTGSVTNAYLLNIEGISGNNIENISINNCTFESISKGCLTFKFVTNLTISECSFKNNSNYSAIQNTETLDNGSKNIQIANNRFENIGIGGANTSHAISINSLNSVKYVNISDNYINNIRNNGIEVWANYVLVHNNTVIDSVISFSFGACQFLNVLGNIAKITTPASSGLGVYGIEIGGCRFVNVNGNLISGHRSGIQTTAIASTGADSEFFSFTANDIKDWGKYTAATYPAILYKEAAGSFSGSPYTNINGNTILNSLNSGIYVNSNFGENIYNINNNIIDLVGYFATPTSFYAGITVVGTTANLNGNVISRVLYYGISSTNGVLNLGQNNFSSIADRVISTTGIHCKVTTSSGQILESCPTPYDLSYTRTFTQGTYDVGDKVYFADSLAGGFIGKICTTKGSLGTQLNTITAGTTAGSTLITVSAIGDFFVGVYITIAGVTGVKKIIGFNPSTLVVTLDSVCNATVVSGAITSSAPVFKTFGAITA